MAKKKKKKKKTEGESKCSEKERTLRGRKVLEQTRGQRANLRGKTRNVVGERSKGVLVVIRSKELPGYGNQTLRGCHFQFPPVFNRRLLLRSKIKLAYTSDLEQT